MPTIEERRARQRADLKKIKGKRKERVLLAKQIARLKARRAARAKRIQDAVARQDKPAIAAKFLIAHYGQHETPGRPNRAPWLDGWAREVGAWMVGQPWCGLTVWKAAKAAGVNLDKTTMSTIAIRSMAQRGVGGFKAWHDRNATPQVGWVAIYGYPGGPVHTGMYVGNGVVAEGNTSPGTGGSQNDGGGLYPRSLSSRRAWLIGWAEVDWDINEDGSRRK